MRSSLEKLLIPLKRIMANGFSSGKAGISWNIDENAFRRFCKIALVIGASSRSMRIFRTTSICAKFGVCSPYGKSTSAVFSASGADSKSL